MPHRTTPDAGIAQTAEALVSMSMAPIDSRAFGAAVGVTAAGCMWVVTAFHILIAPEEAGNVALLSQYFYGYRVDWWGSLIGACWGGVAGFIAGWFLASARNVCAAMWMRIVQARAEFVETRDFLDHM